MGLSIQRRRGTTTQHASFTGQIGELTVDTTKFVVVVHDGITTGGWPMSRFDHTHPNVTESTSGFMSNADKTKLDGITGGPSYYQTIQLNGASEPQESTINISSNFTATDDPAGNRTTIDLSATGVVAGTYTKYTVNVYGRITSGSSLVAGDIPTITSSKISDLATTVQAYKLSQFAVPTATINLNTNQIINLVDPVNPQDAATKNYVDNIAVGLYFKAACVCATTANINLSSPGTTIDTVSLSNGNRVLVKNQSTASQNGIYIFNGSSSAMTRSLDAASGSQIETGTFVFIDSGAVNGGTAWVLSTTGAIVVGTTPLTFVQFSAVNFTAGNGLVLSGGQFSVQTVSSSRITVGSSGIDLATTGVTAGTYNNVTVDVYGRATAGSNVSYQSQNSNLTGLSSLASTGIISNLGSGSFAGRTIQPGTGILITNGDGTGGNIGVALATSGSGAAVQGNSNLATVGYVPYVSSAGTLNIDSTGILFWDSTNHRLGIGTATPSYPLHVTGNVGIGGTIATYDGLIGAATGIGFTVATIDLTAQGANISTANLLASAPLGGMYEFIITIAVTSGASGTAALPNVVVGWTEKNSSVALTNTAIATLTGSTTSVFGQTRVNALVKSSTALTYATTSYAAGSSSMQYDLSIRIVYLG